MRGVSLEDAVEGGGSIVITTRKEEMLQGLALVGGGRPRVVTLTALAA
jgi:hypothetical protein